MRGDHFDWEVLRLDTTTSCCHRRELASRRTEIAAARWSRLRVTVNGRLGQHVSDQLLDPEDCVAPAVAMSHRGPAMHIPFGSHYRLGPTPHRSTNENPPGSDFEEILGSPLVLRTARRRRRARFTTRSGNGLTWVHTDVRIVLGVWDGDNAVPMAAVDDEFPLPPGRLLLPELHRGGGRPGKRSRPWLFSPVALSNILFESWRAALVEPGSREVWPPGLSVVDRGEDALFDLEATPRRPVVFVRDGRVENLPKTLVTVDDVTECTGHGGWLGPAFDDFAVRPTVSLDPPVASPGCLVVATARCLPASPGLTALVVFDSLEPPGPAEVLLIELTDPAVLLTTGRWIAPVQRGSGPWSSPWLEVAEPLRAITVIDGDGP